MNNKQNAVVHFEIYVNDMERAQKFYESVFNIKLNKMTVPEQEEAPAEMLFFPGGPDQMTNYGAGGALVKMPSFEAGVGGSLVYFGCEDCAVEESRVVENGGSIKKSKVSLGEYGFMSLVVDSEGNMIGLHSMK